MPISCFTEFNLYSKKKYLFHDSNVKYAEILLYVLNIILIIDIYNRSKNINTVNIIIYSLLSIYIADFITALFHSYYIDTPLINNNSTYIDESTKKIIINTTTGYSSGHHIFPSNWKDIDDKIIFRDIFIIHIPLFILNYFNPNDNYAYLIYCILYLICISGITHKYAHERNHNRYVPKVIKLLQDLGLTLSGKEHRKHHKELNRDFALLNGISNSFSNMLINKINELLDIKSSEEVIDICKTYVKKYGSDITIKFIGDIEGEIIVNLYGNIIEMKKS